MSALDISLFHQTFSEDFRQPLDVTPWGPSLWIAHTPWNGDFGDAKFADPAPGFPFTTGINGGQITMRKDATGVWESGLLASSNAKGGGFTQAGGYFETRLKLPAGSGVWPAFWLHADGDPLYKYEIDIIEYYGHAPGQYSANTHLWPKDGTTPATNHANILVPTGSLCSSWHTYGAEITPADIVFYMDRQQVASFPAAAASQYPMTILLDLGLGGGWPIDQTPNPSVLKVDYVKAFLRN